LGPLLFLLCVNDLSKTINGNSKPVLFADDISVIGTSSKLEDFQKHITTEFASLNMWFKSSKLTINFGKTHFMQFTTKNSHLIDVDVNYANKSISEAYDTRFLGIYVDSTLFWKTHTENIRQKLSAACYAMRSVKLLMSLESLKMAYYAYFRSIMSYGLIFWGNSSHSSDIFKIQKTVIRIITGCRRRDSCRNLFKKLKILSLQSHYILSIILFGVNNKNEFRIISDVHHINTRQKNNFSQPSSTLSLYQKGVYSTGIKIFNHLPPRIRNLSDNPKQFKLALRKYLYGHSYSVEE
jgi:hypothetical protein